MRRITVLLLTLALFPACNDGNLVQPDEDLTPDPFALSANEFPNMNVPGGIPFELDMTFLGPVEAGEQRVTPSGVLHVIGADNLFELSGDFLGTGDLLGTGHFIGNYTINLRNGKGRSIGMGRTFEFTSPGVGTFECADVTGTIKGYLPPSYALIQFGTWTGCKGTGYFEGKKMNARFTNEQNPGVFGYKVWGVIW